MLSGQNACNSFVKNTPATPNDVGQGLENLGKAVAWGVVAGADAVAVAAAVNTKSWSGVVTSASTVENSLNNADANINSRAAQDAIDAISQSVEQSPSSFDPSWLLYAPLAKGATSPAVPQPAVSHGAMAPLLATAAPIRWPISACSATGSSRASQ